jgi:hypothetical protein
LSPNAAGAEAHHGGSSRRRHPNRHLPRKKRYGSRAGRGSGILSDGEGDDFSEDQDEEYGSGSDVEYDDEGEPEVAKKGSDQEQDDELIFNEEDEAIHVHKAYRESMHLQVCPSRIAAATAAASLSEDNLSLAAGGPEEKAKSPASKEKEREKDKKKKRAMTFGQLRTLLTHHKDSDKSGTRGRMGSEEKEKERERKREEKGREKSERAAARAKHTRKDLHATTAPASHSPSRLMSSGGSSSSGSGQSPSHSRSPSISSPSHSRNPSSSSSSSATASTVTQELHPYKNHAGQTPLHVAIDTFAERIGKGREDESDDIETVCAIIDDAKVR